MYFNGNGNASVAADTQCGLASNASLINNSGGSKGGAPAACPPTAQNFLNFMQFFGKCWRNRRLEPPLKGWRPLLRGILDPPLNN